MAASSSTKILGWASAALTVTLLATNLFGANPSSWFRSIFGLDEFAKKAVLKIRRFYSLSLSSDFKSIKFKIDLDVENGTDINVTATNLIVNAYNSANEFIGKSDPYPGPVTLAALATSTITGINITADISKLVSTYGASAIETIKQIFASMSADNVRLNEQITLDVFITMNGINVNEKIPYTI